MIGRIHALCMSFSLLTSEKDKPSYFILKSNPSAPSLELCLDDQLTKSGVVRREQSSRYTTSHHQLLTKEMAHKGQVVMVTGGAGFLGQHIVKLLQEKTDDVREIRVFDLKPYTNNLGHTEEKPLMSIVGDIRRIEEVSEAMKGVDSVIHTAGLVSFGTFPDFEGMEQVNVNGTNNVIKACIDRSVKRLIYTSTVDVVVGDDEILDGDESLPIPRKFLFPGYPDTKYRAEQAVIQANGTSLKCGGDCFLRTLALRPPVMYGEYDPYYIISGLKAAIERNGVLPRVGDGKSLLQQAYVGNVAWGHIVADEALARDADVGGQVYFITDDTPNMNSASFLELFLKARGMSLSTYSIPYSLIYCIMYATESFLHLIAPIYKLNLSTPLCSLAYVNKNIYFNRSKADRMLGYKPLYDFSTSISLATAYYSKWSPKP